MCTLVLLLVSLCVVDSRKFRVATASIDRVNISRFGKYANGCAFALPDKRHSFH